MDHIRPEWLAEVTGILESLNQGVVINDSSNRIVFANALFLKMIEMPAEELLGRTVLDLYQPEDAKALLKHIERRREEGHGLYEFFLPRPSGQRLPVLVTVRQVTDNEGHTFAVITATDITAQKQAEARLRLANEELERRHQEIEEDLLLAARVQQSLAPNSIRWGGVSVEAFYQPVRTIGGDFGLVAPRTDGLNIMVCDVSGHGIGSALVANRIYTEAMSQIERGAGVGPMMGHLNRFVLRNLGSSVFYFTMAAARYIPASRVLEFAGAGHPPALIVEPGSSPRLIESQSAVLGILEDAVQSDATTEIPVRPGERIVIYTDGFTESFNPQREMLGVEGLCEIVRETATLPLASMKKEIIDRVGAWRGGPPEDDMSLVVLEVV